jgi:hypothetical protein
MSQSRQGERRRDPRSQFARQRVHLHPCFTKNAISRDVACERLRLPQQASLPLQPLRVPEATLTRTSRDQP